MKPYHLLPLLGPVLFNVRFSYAASPPVQVELRSSWSAPPYLLEIIEAVTSEESSAFFPLVDAMTAPELSTRTLASPEALRNYTLDAAVSQGFLSEAGLLASVDMGLALHSSLPKIEAFYQYYLDRQATRKNASEFTHCDSWVDWYGQIVCDVDTLAKLSRLEIVDQFGGESTNTSFSRPKLLTFDHIRPDPSETLERPPQTAILYASMLSSNFRELHTYLYEASSGLSPRLEYVFRPIPIGGPESDERIHLSGYGVALDLKKMDYLALDDRRHNSKVDDHHPEDLHDLDAHIDPVAILLQQYPENDTAETSTPLTDQELLQIGLQSTQLIHDSGAPLSTLKQLAQNFPKYAATLARRVTVDADLEEEVQSNQLKAQGGVSMAWLNGIVIPETDMNPFALLRLLRKERATMSSLISLGLSSEQAVELLTHRAVSVAQSDSGVLDGVFDASDRPEEGGVIVWWSDFENDPRYARWGTSIKLLLRPMYPGQFPTIRLNLFNVVLAVDLSQSSSLHFIAGAVANIVGRSLPFRFGVAPLVETEDGIKMARLFYWLIENVGTAPTMDFIQHISQVHTPAHLLTPLVDWSLVRSTFAELLIAYKEDIPATTEKDLDIILRGPEAASDIVIQKARAYARRLGTDLASASQGHAFVNGKHFELNDEFLRNMQMEVGQQMQHFQEKLYSGELDDSHADTMSTYFYDLPQANKRRNRHIYPSGGTGDLRIFGLTELLSKSRFPRLPGSFVYPEESEQTPLTTFVVADLDTAAGLDLVKEALTSMKKGTISRLSFIHNPAASNEGPTQASSLLAHLIVKGSLHKVSPTRLLTLLGLGDPLSSKQSTQVVMSPEGSIDDLLGGSPLHDEQAFGTYTESSRLILRELKLVPGEQALIVNGRVIGPVAEGDFTAEDFESLTNYEYRKRVEPVVEALEDILGSFDGFDRGSLAEVVSLASSVISSIQLPDPSEAGLFNAPQRPRRRNYQLLAGNYTKFEFGNNSTALFHFGILLDPLSEAAQKWSSLLEWLLNDSTVFVELHVNPARYRELPLKRFYRYNVPSRLIFDENGVEVRSQAVFHDLPTEPIYTLAMDVASSWLVRPREASYDLDNIQLGSLSGQDRTSGVQAVFDLDYLVVEGHARDVLTNAPPRGLQLQLTTSDGTPIADTQVVANLGYLQFRTKPGVFQLEIRPGRGQEIYSMESVGNEGWNSPAVSEVGNEITLTSFEGLTLYPRVARRPGMEHTDVLADDRVEDSEPKGLFENVVSSLSSLFNKQATEVAPVDVGDGHADINIFTVASGLLYERFASIMILSVLRNTNSTVKFWFIENFLSPSFLEFIPHFAKAYGFKYELVTYKWPSWLRAQTEKQRIIWAYKILFLDVLFPMDLKKVIFVDADQIVRADLKELVELDLHGAPYGYTPMGDDNTDMEGFRFWKTGYWEEFLRGLPYHISALYVVDLVRFRQIAAGDILRGHYQQLSADPNSLANLDQDLPNNLQREVPIFSLPEDWLWCETWCSKDRLHRAKTIDLCQNPLTKEPKLSRARQIPEWEEYDAEIARFARTLAEQGVIRSGIVATDANALADAAGGRQAGKDDGKSEHPDALPTETGEQHLKDEL